MTHAEDLYGEDGTPLIGRWSLDHAEQHARDGVVGSALYSSHLLATLHAIDLLKRERDTAIAERNARSTVLKDVIAQRDQAYRARDAAQRERDDARAALAAAKSGRDWARLVAGLREKGELDHVAGLAEAVTVALDAIDQAKQRANRLRREMRAVAADLHDDWQAWSHRHELGELAHRYRDRLHKVLGDDRG